VHAVKIDPLEAHLGRSPPGPAAFPVRVGEQIRLILRIVEGGGPVSALDARMGSAGRCNDAGKLAQRLQLRGGTGLITTTLSQRATWRTTMPARHVFAWCSFSGEEWPHKTPGQKQVHLCLAWGKASQPDREGVREPRTYRPRRRT
jgi:hypothetical protein